MRDIDRAERLLSLFASPNCAAGIAGDLSEERGQRGSVWFWRHVLGTALSLWRVALFESPVVVLGLVVLGFLLLTASSLGGTVAVGYTLQLLNPKVPLQLLVGVLLVLPACVLIWWYGAALAGASLVAVSPRRGMVACMLLAVAFELLLLALGVNMLASKPINSLLGVWIVGLTVPVFVLRGGDKLRRRRMKQPA